METAHNEGLIFKTPQNRRNEPLQEHLCRHMTRRKMHLIHVRDISIRANAQRPNLSHLMQKILSDKTNADGELRRSVGLACRPLAGMFRCDCTQIGLVK